MVYKSEIVLILVWATIALLHSWLIKNNRRIYHGLWAALAVVLILAAGWLSRAVLATWWEMGLYVVAQGCARLVVFNVALNRFRGLSWTYVSKISTSLIDRAELRLFGTRVWLLEVILGVVFLILQLFL